MMHTEKKNCVLFYSPQINNEENNPNGQSETFDMSEMQFHEIYDKFEKNGIKASTYGYTMGDARKENAPITLSSDSDMGNAVLKLFIQDR